MREGGGREGGKDIYYCMCEIGRERERERERESYCAREGGRCYNNSKILYIDFHSIILCSFCIGIPSFPGSSMGVLGINTLLAIPCGGACFMSRAREATAA